MQAEPQTKKRPTTRISKWYKADDQPRHFERRQKQVKSKTAKLRSNITPGTVLILLAGRFRGKRVIFLKQLASGLLLVTGPHKINGVPLRRVNQAYVIATKTKVDITGIQVDKVDDKYFAKTLQKYRKRTQELFFKAHEGKKQEYDASEANRITQKKIVQKEVDKPILQKLSKECLLKGYLSARFSLSNNSKPHEMVF